MSEQKELTPKQAQQLADATGLGLAYAASDLKKYSSGITGRHDLPPLPIGLTFDGPDYAIDHNVDSYRNFDGHMSDGVAHSTTQGKMPWHVVYSDESPIKDISGNVAPRWDTAEDTGMNTYYPTLKQLGEQEYLHRLQESFNREKGKGIDQVIMPAGSVYSDIH